MNKPLGMLIISGAVLLLVVVAVHFLGRGGDLRNPVETLENEDSETGTRLDAARELGNSRNPENVAVLGRHAGGSDADLARRSLLSLGKIGTPAAVKHIRPALKDTRPPVREAAAAAMGRVEREIADAGVLAEALEADEAPAVRCAAAKSLGHLYSWDAMPQLVAALEDPDVRVRRRAIKAVRRILGVNYGYRADAPDREVALEKIKANWPKFKKSHEAHMARLKREAGQ